MPLVRLTSVRYYNAYTGWERRVCVADCAAADLMDPFNIQPTPALLCSQPRPINRSVQSRRFPTRFFVTRAGSDCVCQRKSVA